MYALRSINHSASAQWLQTWFLRFVPQESASPHTAVYRLCCLSCASTPTPRAPLTHFAHGLSNECHCPLSHFSATAHCHTSAMLTSHECHCPPSHFNHAHFTLVHSQYPPGLHAAKRLLPVPSPRILQLELRMVTPAEAPYLCCGHSNLCCTAELTSLFSPCDALRINITESLRNVGLYDPSVAVASRLP
jgi:hypothetical protein